MSDAPLSHDEEALAHSLDNTLSMDKSLRQNGKISLTFAQSMEYFSSENFFIY